jgi:hypothetical protein
VRSHLVIARPFRAISLSHGQGRALTYNFAVEKPRDNFIVRIWWHNKVIARFSCKSDLTESKQNFYIHRGSRGAGVLMLCTLSPSGGEHPTRCTRFALNWPVVTGNEEYTRIRHWNCYHCWQLKRTNQPPSRNSLQTSELVGYALLQRRYSGQW